MQAPSKLVVTPSKRASTPSKEALTLSKRVGSGVEVSLITGSKAAENTINLIS